MSTHILIAEDDTNIRIGLTDTLESEGYTVTAAEDGKGALDEFQKQDFGLVILDIMMPEISGYDVLKKIRETNETIPVIMLTAKGQEIDKVVGLRLGADDYVTKPFGIHELLARIAAVLRRAGLGTEKTTEAEETDRFSIGEWTVNTKSFRIVKENRNIDISERELKILKLFHSRPDEVLSRDTILNEIWGVDYYGTTRTLDQHIAQLRKKIESDPANPTLITTVHGVGYRYCPSEEM